MGLGGGAAPVIVDAGEAVQRRGEAVVEGAQRPRGEEPLAVEQARVLPPLRQRARLHRAQEHARVDEPVEAAVDGGAVAYVRVAAPGVRPDFIDALAGYVREALA